RPQGSAHRMPVLACYGEPECGDAPSNAGGIRSVYERPIGGELETCDPTVLHRDPVVEPVEEGGEVAVGGVSSDDVQRVGERPLELGDALFEFVDAGRRVGHVDAS